MDIYKSVEKLCAYGIETGILKQQDAVYAVNRLYDVLKLDGQDEITVTPDYNREYSEDGKALYEILSELLAYAVENHLVEDTIGERDRFDTKLMDCLLPMPSVVADRFYSLYKEDCKKATDMYYKFCKDSDYIRRYRIAKDRKWTAETEYGTLDITINLSKPEKDPKAIAAALKNKSVSYPKCMLCHENEGYAGRMDYPARNTLRTIPLTLNQEDWYLQYSPYVYYNEHCIIFNAKHTPMVINHAAFDKLLDFVHQFPHYFAGSNADLPIVGGSILTHEHFQGGNYEFAMAKAGTEESFTLPSYPNVTMAIVKWPMSVLRLSSDDREQLADLADHILTKWRGYTDEAAMIFACTDGVPHNTITPIARRRNGKYELDLVLRNNITTKECPDGLYHPHKEYHHIKKENIGLIEVMGVAILPSRLKTELAAVKECILSGNDPMASELTKKHADWISELLTKHPEINEANADVILEDEVGKVFCAILAQAGVFKRNKEGKEAFLRFIATL